MVFSEEARGLREDSDRARKGPGRLSELPAAVARTGKKAAPDDLFLRQVYGGDTGTGGPDGRANPATASCLEQDLEDKHDAAAMVRLRLKTYYGRGEGGTDGEEKKERAITVVCSHLFHDPTRPDLKTAQCQMLFQAIHRFHEKCGVVPILGGQVCDERSSHGVANLIMCADFNSKPVADPAFWPRPLKVSATQGNRLVEVWCGHKWGANYVTLLHSEFAVRETRKRLGRYMNPRVSRCIVVVVFCFPTTGWRKSASYLWHCENKNSLRIGRSLSALTFSFFLCS